MGVAVSFGLSALFGTVPAFHVGLLGFPLALSALYLMPAVPVKWLVNETSRLCLLYLYGSLLAGILAFGWASEWPYTQGYFDWLPIRLHGVCSNQGSLSPVLVIYLLITLFADRRPMLWPRKIHFLFAVIALFLTQSKVGWALASVVLALRVGLPFFLAFDVKTRFSVLLVAVALVICLLGLVDSETLLNKFGDSEDNLTTLTGRTDIWGYSIMFWRENPVFGYGNLLWTVSMPAKDLGLVGWIPNQTHSQFVQALAQTGLIGAFVFAMYAVSLIGSGYRAALATGWISLILPVMLLVRGLTESWLRHVVTDGNLFVHAICLAFIICGLRSDPAREQPA